MRELVKYGGTIITSYGNCAEPEIFDSFPSMRGWRGVVFEVLKRAIAGATEDIDARRARLGEVERRNQRVLSIALQEQVSELVGVNSEFNHYENPATCAYIYQVPAYGGSMHRFFFDKQKKSPLTFA